MRIVAIVAWSRYVNEAGDNFFYVVERLMQPRSLIRSIFRMGPSQMRNYCFFTDLLSNGTRSTQLMSRYPLRHVRSHL